LIPPPLAGRRLRANRSKMLGGFTDNVFSFSCV
jgi:hypothetical protein